MCKNWLFVCLYISCLTVYLIVELVHSKAGREDLEMPGGDGGWFLILLMRTKPIERCSFSSEESRDDSI